MAFHLEQEETLKPEELAALQKRKLRALVHEVLRSNPFYQACYSRCEDAAARPLAGLPFVTKSEIQKDQALHPPYGTNLTYPLAEYTRMHQTSGSAGTPMRWLDRAADWAWWKRCWAIVYRAAGLTPSDRLVFPFSFGPFVGFWAAFESAVELGNLSLAAGGMTTKARLQYILDNDVTVVCCTPTYALHMAEVARTELIELAGSRVRALIVAGEPGGSIPATRARIESAWGARLFDHAGMTEVGPFAFECVESPGAVHIAENEFIAEVIDPQQLTPVEPGQAGELVLTNLGRWGSPLIRYRTGDLVRLASGRCACGRWFARLEGGILGRIDDMVTIRGNNVYPAAVEAILREFPAIAEYRLSTVSDGAMSDLKIELEPSRQADSRDLVERVAAVVRDRLHFRPVVRLVEPGSLPRFEMKARRWFRGN